MSKLLRRYQQDALRYLLEHKHGALFMEMRLGKTLIVIRRIKLSGDIAQRILVVAPYSALLSWREELTEEGQVYLDLLGEVHERVDLLDFASRYQGRLWVLWNKEGHLSNGEVAGYSWDVVILDESVFIKNPQAQVSKYFLKHFRGAKIRIVMCGTPAPETPLEYFNQLAFLSSKYWQEWSYWQFRMKHFKQTGFDWRVTEEGRKYIAYVLGKHAFCLKREDVKMGGVKVYEQRAVQLPVELRKTYQLIEAEFILSYDNREVDRSIYATDKYVWLRRLCSGWVGLEFVDDFKIKELFNLLDGELHGQQIVIWCKFLLEIAAISTRLTAKGHSVGVVTGAIKPQARDGIKKQFQAGQIQYIVAQPECWKYGTDLNAAGGMIYFSSPEAALTRQQSEDRTINVSVSDNALIIDMLTLDTVEEDNVLSLIKKETWAATTHRMAINVQRRLHAYQHLA